MMRRRLAAVAAAAGMSALALAIPAASSGQPAPEAAAKPAPTRDSYRETKPLSRVFVDADGVERPQWQGEMTVTARGLTELRGRERVEISWTGARPSGGRASNPYGEKGLEQEYPVVILQCRGLDDPDLPMKKRVAPETCWSSSVAHRSQVTRSAVEASWRVDQVAADEDRRTVSGMDPFPSAECPDMEGIGATRVTPFIARDGTVYPFCNAATVAPEASVDSASPPAEVAAFSDEEGRGSVQFEVRSNVENASLGCSYQVACSIVVIPIVGLSCAQPTEETALEDRACRQHGEFAPGSSNFAGVGADQAVSPKLWWSASNWRHRFSIPIEFGLPPDACDLLDPRPPTSFYGSELMAQAALQWSPAYCLRKDRFKFRLSQMSDEAGWNLMEDGGGPAAFVSSEHKRTGADPVGYAPTAVTGFSVGYVIDRPDNAGEYTELRLNARLIAKLLTQSYVGSALGEGHPGMADNPWAITVDPEFVELNPGLTDNADEAAATLASLSVSSDIIGQLTEYIANDKEAAAFVAGKPDQWGMRVNPSYEDIDLPRPVWPLLDTYVPTEDPCWKDVGTPYLSQVAGAVSSLRPIADAVIDAWPLSQSVCVKDLVSDEHTLGRKAQQPFGARFLLGLVSTADAARFGLRQAALETRPGTFVAPSNASMAAAVKLADQKKRYGPFSLTQRRLVRAGKAYPGTMIVYTTARLQNLEQTQADSVSQFIRIATTEGQRPGSGNGELPAGYLPIRRTGVTGPLWRAAQETADAIEAQRADDDEEEEKEPDGDGTTPPSDSTPTDPESSETPGEDEQPDQGPEDTETAPTAATQAESSGIGKSLLPVLLIIALLAGASSIVSGVVGSRAGRP